jgi:hypothetical protein
MEKGKIYKCNESFVHPFIYIRVYDKNPDLFVGVMLTRYSGNKIDPNINFRQNHIIIHNHEILMEGTSYFVNDWLLKHFPEDDALLAGELTKEGLEYLENSLLSKKEPIPWSKRKSQFFKNSGLILINGTFQRHLENLGI